MAKAAIIFRLYRIADGTAVHYMLAKAVRPEFPNWNQAAEDKARDEVDRRLDAIVAQEAGLHAEVNLEAIATWESALPEGNCFYEPRSGTNLAIWFALDTVHPGYFVFGAHPDEASFWAYIEGLSRDGEICAITDYARPAQCVQVRFVQPPTADRPGV